MTFLKTLNRNQSFLPTKLKITDNNVISIDPDPFNQTPANAMIGIKV